MNSAVKSSVESFLFHFPTTFLFWLYLTAFGISFQGVVHNLNQNRYFETGIALIAAFGFGLLAQLLPNQSNAIRLLKPSRPSYIQSVIDLQGVYIIQDISVSGYCKIGRTNCFARRLHKFEVVLPFEYQIIHLIPHHNPGWLESELHRRFQNVRMRGEWFDLEPMQIDWIKQYHEINRR